MEHRPAAGLATLTPRLQAREINRSLDPWRRGRGRQASLPPRHRRESLSPAGKERPPMSTSHEEIEKRILHEPAKKPYMSPLLTRYGTVEELTPIIADVGTGSRIPTDFNVGGQD